MLDGMKIVRAFGSALARQRRGGGSAAFWCMLAAAAVACAACTSPRSVPVPGARSVTSASVTSASPASNLHEPGYLALGDSIAFGYRPSSVTPAGDYRHPADLIGYPQDIARTLGLDLVNASCPGETTASMIEEAAPSNGCETNARGAPGYRSFEPLHVSYAGSQLGYAVRYLRLHPDTQLVTIDIGVNDLLRCQGTTSDHCAGPDFGRTLAEVTQNLNTILGGLRNRARYRHALVVLTYYALSYGDRVATGRTGALNAALAQAAGRYGARVADGFGAFRSASARDDGNTCAAGLRIRLPGGGCDLHPTAYGQQILARAVEAAIGR
jgi:lysophospholipase L1-like esterase